MVIRTYVFRPDDGLEWCLDDGLTCAVIENGSQFTDSVVCQRSIATPCRLG